jgi:hypothetical protein
VGCPIRRSMDQSSFAAPHGLSQRITSFFACACQGIHQMPLRHLIVLIANAHQYSHPSAQTLKVQPNAWRTGYLLQPALLMMPSTCSTDLLVWNYAEQFACSLSLRPASRDVIQDRAVRQRPSVSHQSHSSGQVPQNDNNDRPE